MFQKVLFISILGGLCSGYDTTPFRPKLKLVIDHDGGADDAMAVIMCILYERYFDGPEVVGLTTTHGNVNESQVFSNTIRFLDLTGRRDVPIYRGAVRSLVVSAKSNFYFGLDGIGDYTNNSRVEIINAQDQHAALGLIELSKIYKGELVVLAIGPLTNIALAQSLDPGFIGRLAQLYVAAGHIYNKDDPQFSRPEFNAAMDVEAYRIVANNAQAHKVTLVHFSQIITSLTLTREWRKNVLGSIDTPVMNSLTSYERLSLATNKYWYLLDPAAAAIVLHDNVVGDYKYTKNNISLCGTYRGINSNVLGSKGANMRLVYNIVQDIYANLLIDIFSAELLDPTLSRR